ncbi:hypothetical protein MJH54_28590, partial [Salmonella enterica subsp. enterica serovar Montevideo]|nr:hypothetical protein [Salmonella enterica subsp. enterica serovar Montevideo]
KLRAAADYEVTKTLAEAERQGRIMRGEGDAEAAKLFADAFSHQKSVYGTGIAADGHTLNRGTIVDNERLQNFSVDTQLESKFAT